MAVNNVRKDGKNIRMDWFEVEMVFLFNNNERDNFNILGKLEASMVFIVTNVYNNFKKEEILVALDKDVMANYDSEVVEPFIYV